MRKRRVLWAIGIAAVLGVAVLVVLYLLGTPSVQAEPAVRAQIADEADSAVSTEVPEPDPSSPLAIQIPGCVCHSDDPELVKEHESYRMNQCAGCHAGGVPTRP